MKNKTMNRYDIIGDIHGECAALEYLLAKLGYHEGPEGYSHPEERKAIFVGDLIDRGPNSRGALHLVRRMKDAGNADVIMGNHEFNFVSYKTPNSEGGFLRPHNEKNDSQVAATLKSFSGHEDEIPEFLEWMRSLPLFLDFGDFRVVHASWISEDICYLKDKSLLDDPFLQEANRKGSRAYEAIEHVLKGLELPLPNGKQINDSNGIPRKEMRIRWWGENSGLTWKEIAFPPLPDLEDDSPVRLADMERLVDYAGTEPPVFFGHYKLTHSDLRLEALNVKCLDYGLGHGGPATAYRWDGDSELDLSRVVQCHQTAPSKLASIAKP